MSAKHGNKGPTVNRVIFVTYAIFIAVVSLLPMSGTNIGSSDKVFHVLMYGVFSVLGFRVTTESKQYLYLCIGIVAYGGLMEIAQSFMPGRMMSAYDFLANAVGVIIGALVAKRVFRAKIV